MSEEIYQEFLHQGNKDISKIEIRKKKWDNGFWISVISLVISSILSLFTVSLGVISALYVILVISLLLGFIFSILMVAESYMIKRITQKIGNIKNQINNAVQREKAKDYDSAIEIWESLGEIEEAARIRELQAEMGSVKVAQNVVQGDQITEVKDSVLNRSNVGAISKCNSGFLFYLSKLTPIKLKLFMLVYYFNHVDLKSFKSRNFSKNIQLILI